MEFLLQEFEPILKTMEATIFNPSTLEELRNLAGEEKRHDGQPKTGLHLEAQQYQDIHKQANQLKSILIPRIFDNGYADAVIESMNWPVGGKLHHQGFLHCFIDWPTLSGMLKSEPDLQTAMQEEAFRESPQDTVKPTFRLRYNEKLLQRLVYGQADLNERLNILFMLERMKCTRIRVTNLCHLVGESKLESFFSSFGEIVETQIIEGESEIERYGTVRFTHGDSAQLATGFMQCFPIGMKLVNIRIFPDAEVTLTDIHLIQVRRLSNPLVPTYFVLDEEGRSIFHFLEDVMPQDGIEGPTFHGQVGHLQAALGPDKGTAIGLNNGCRDRVEALPDYIEQHFNQQYPRSFHFNPGDLENNHVESSIDDRSCKPTFLSKSIADDPDNPHGAYIVDPPICTFT